MSKYEQVDWSEAACSGMPVDIFYDIEEERSVDAYHFINALRQTCVRCPIWAHCLAYAFQNEDYGIWGGMSSLERRSLWEPEKYGKQKNRAKDNLWSHGIAWEQVKEIYEHSHNVRRVENETPANRKNGSSSYLRSRKR